MASEAKRFNFWGENGLKEPKMSHKSDILIYRVDHKVVWLGANKKLFLWSHDFQKCNFKITALPVIPIIDIISSGVWGKHLLTFAKHAR
jgi:hypothetical protein